jgi:hypothetical protein
MTFSLSLRSNERALLVRDGRPKAWLEPGRHRLWSWGAEMQATTYDLDRASAKMTPELQAVLPADAAEILEVPEGELALVSVDDRPHHVLEPGRYALWKGRGKITSRPLSLTPVIGEVPLGFARLVPAAMVEEALVQPHERALLLVDGALHTVLGAGRYFVFKHQREVQLIRVDLREREAQIIG